MHNQHQISLFSHEQLGPPRSTSISRRKPSASERRDASSERHAPGLSPFQAFPTPHFARETKFDHMRNAASPPMLGADLTFRTFLSPQSTRLDPDQYPCFSANRGPQAGGDGSGGVGLWMGFCTAADPRPSTPPASKIGISTPTHSPSTHLPSALTAARVATDDDSDDSIEADFSDSFVTQVYNYLSLGYPSLARKFDAELCKISKIPMAELARDDEDAAALKRGFIELEDVGQETVPPRAAAAKKEDGSTGTGSCNGRGARWRALRLYVREWARQHRGDEGADMSQGALESWGARARRGSWAV